MGREVRTSFRGVRFQCFTVSNSIRDNPLGFDHNSEPGEAYTN